MKGVRRKNAAEGAAAKRQVHVGGCTDVVSSGCHELPRQVQPKEISIEPDDVALRLCVRKKMSKVTGSARQIQNRSRRLAHDRCQTQCCKVARLSESKCQVVVHLDTRISS